LFKGNWQISKEIVRESHVSLSGERDCGLKLKNFRFFTFGADILAPDNPRATRQANRSTRAPKELQANFIKKDFAGGLAPGWWRPGFGVATRRRDFCGLALAPAFCALFWRLILAPYFCALFLRLKKPP
jgi:hypothetical protein